jgi:Predicted transcriptional regulators
MRLQDRNVREAFVSAHVSNGIAFQIRSLRRGRKWTQEQLATAAGTKPTQIGRVENPDYGSHTITVLRRIASAFDVALVVRFAPYSELLRWDAGPRNLAPKPFWQELRDARVESASSSQINGQWASCAVGGLTSNVLSIEMPGQAAMFAVVPTGASQEIEQLSGGRYATANAG